MTDQQFIDYCNDNIDKKKYLFIIPDLSLNGANTVLYELLSYITCYHDESSEHFIISSANGPFAAKYEALGCHIWIRENVYCPHDIRELLSRGFTYVFLNTSSVHYYALFFMNTPVKTYWWFHESYEQLSNEQENFLHLGLLSDNFKILGVTNKVLSALREIFGINADLFPMIINDIHDSIPATTPDKRTIKFFIPGAYTYIKGQDLLLKAISELPIEYRSKAQFIFAGYQIPTQNEYYQLIQKIANLLPEVVMLNSISREEVYKYMLSSDCIIAPSRTDSTPTTIVEAMMLKKLCLVSTGTGISEYMTDCVNGFVFDNENYSELQKRIMFIISELSSGDSRDIDGLAIAGRHLYEKMFSKEALLPLLKNYELI